MKNPIIESRLNKMIQRKQQLLKVKKSERGNELKETEDVINRLKKWLADPATHVQTPQQEQCNTGNPAGHPKDRKKERINLTIATGGAIKAFQDFAKALGTIRPDEVKTEDDIREIIHGKNDHIDAMSYAVQTQMIKNEAFTRRTKERPGNGPQMTETDTKGPFETGQWPEETPEAYQNRLVDIQTAFRRMSGWC